MTALQTRDALLQAARLSFAARGYFGTSLSGVAAEVGVTKQALLHHFGTKQQLHRAVQEQAERDLLQMLFAAMEEGQSPEHQLESFFIALTERGMAQPWLPNLLLQTLMQQGGGDAPTAADKAPQGAPPLREFLEPLIAVIQATQRWRGAPFSDALAVALQLLGGSCLLPAAQAGVDQRFGADVGDAMGQTALRHLQDLLAARL